MTEVIDLTKLGKEETLLERAQRLTGRIVPPHSKKSRHATEEDMERMLKEIDILYELCFIPSGKYQGAYAMHHSQIDDKDPLDFFVTADKKIVINPTVVRHSNYTVDSKEACKSFNDKDPIIVQRWHKVEVEYVTIMVDPKDENKFKFSSPLRENVSGKEAFVFQHEMDHGQAKYIYEY